MSYDEKNLDDTLTSSSVSENKPKTGNALVELIQFVLLALIIVLPIRWFIAQPFIVSGASMESTFHNNEYLIVDQLTYHLREPERGEVIILRFPNDHSKFFIKRIIGLPGETVEIEGSRVTIKNDEDTDGFVLSEPYIASMTGPNHQIKKLGADEYFVMGDNRDHSSDSRAWGALKREEIIGRAWIRLLPPNRLSFLPGSDSQ